MRRFLPYWLVPLVLILWGALPRAAADDELHPGLKNGIGLPTAQPALNAPTDSGDKTEKPPPTFAYFVAVVAAIVVLCVLCVPSRKAESSTARR